MWLGHLQAILKSQPKHGFTYKMGFTLFYSTQERLYFSQIYQVCFVPFQIYYYSATGNEAVITLS